MSLRDVLGVLGNDEGRSWVTFDRAVQVAEAEHARLTLAKTTDPGWLMRWFAPAAIQSMAVTAFDLELETSARDMLARAAEFVPAQIPVTTMLLGRPTGPALRELIRSGSHDALVCSDTLLAHNARLRRELTRRYVRTITVSRDPKPTANQPAALPAIHEAPA